MTHKRKYNPQAVPEPVKFGVIPLYRPVNPSSWTIERRAWRRLR